MLLLPAGVTVTVPLAQVPDAATPLVTNPAGNVSVKLKVCVVLAAG